MILSAAVGAPATVAAARGPVLPHRTGPPVPPGKPRSGWPIAPPKGWPPAPQAEFTRPAFGCLYWRVEGENRDWACIATETRAGVPLLSMRGVSTDELPLRKLISGDF